MKAKGKKYRFCRMLVKRVESKLWDIYETYEEKKVYNFFTRRSLKYDFVRLTKWLTRTLVSSPHKLDLYLSQSLLSLNVVIF